MTLFVKRSTLSLLPLVIIPYTGCGDSSLSLSGQYEVRDVDIIANTISVGEAVRTEIYFDTRTQIGGQPETIELVAKLPASLRYKPSTSRILDSPSGSSDEFSPEQVVDCPDGTSFVQYEFFSSDLRGREVNGAGTYGMKFEVVGVAPELEATIQAAAGEDQEFSCNSFFGSEKDERVSVQ